MTNKHWESLKNIIAGKNDGQVKAGFIIDSPWLPNWAGMKIIDYFTNEEMWFEAHLKAAESFPEVIFFPGFWSEFGMCTEPSAFGAKCVFPEDEFPHAHKMIEDITRVDKLKKPNSATDGLLPFMLKRLVHMRVKMEQNGHYTRFSVSRGPLNIASYLMGTTEFLMAMMMEPEKTHKLIRIITDFLIEWHNLQKKALPEIEGIMMLDDIIGFMSRDQFEEFGLQYFKEIYDRPLPVKLLHNDAPSRESAPLLPEMGVNIFNMGVDISMNDLIQNTGGNVIMLGNLPPRDVLATGTPQQIENETTKMLNEIKDPNKIMASCGGGMPPGVPTENIKSFMKSVNTFNNKMYN
jgi:uroporphyrinogen decarboxylase